MLPPLATASSLYFPALSAKLGCLELQRGVCPVLKLCRVQCCRGLGLPLQCRRPLDKRQHELSLPDGRTTFGSARWWWWRLLLQLLLFAKALVPGANGPM
eukprot:SAG22_NODE_177_length_16160_cov_41.299296_6_plen_100_part_00